MNKKKTTITASVAAVFCAATLALFGISGDKTVYVDYDINQTDIKAEMSLYLPEDFNADIAELLCNDMSVTKAVLPNDSLATIPFIFTDLNNLEIRFYRIGEVIGVGKFENGRIKVAVKDNIKDLPSETDEPVNIDTPSDEPEGAKIDTEEISETETADEPTDTATDETTDESTVETLDDTPDEPTIDEDKINEEVQLDVENNNVEENAE